MIRTETQGGWDSVKNVINAPAAPNLVSGFFPAPQRGKIKSAVMLSRGPAGAAHRKTRYEMQSVLETHRMRAKNWIGSPYAKELAVLTKRRESAALAGKVTTKAPIVRRVII